MKYVKFAFTSLKCENDMMTIVKPSNTMIIGSYYCNIMLSL